jgi:SAM-dependent methyltransferase
MSNKNTQDEQRKYGRYIYPYLEKYIPKNSNILEVGSAEGGLLEIFCSNGHRVTGIEISESRAIKSSIQTFIKDICDYNTSERYDLIIMVDVIEHIDLPSVAIDRIYDLLKPGGYLYITFPPKYSPYAGHQQHYKLLKYIPWISLLPESIIRLLRNTDAIIENKRRAVSVEEFDRIIKLNKIEIIEKNLYFIRPQYKIRYGWKPRKAWFKYLTFGAEYLLRRRNDKHNSTL